VGIAAAFKGSIPTGGQREPNSTAGLKELCKYPQNTKKKNITSVIINNTIPLVNILTTDIVWSPFKLPSEIISLNHKDMFIINAIVLISNKKLAFVAP
jgi:hypothetical protein